MWFYHNKSEGASKFAAVEPLCQRVDGIHRRGGLGALVALRLVLVLLHCVLADERAVFVELPVSSLAVVHQAVVAFLYVAIQGSLAALQRLVVLVAAAMKQQC